LPNGAPLRVILLSGDLSLPPCGGIATHVLGLGAALLAAGHTVRILAPEYGSHDERVEYEGLSVERVRTDGMRAVRYAKLVRRTRSRLREVARELDADLLHVHDFLLGPPISRPFSSRLPVVFTNHTSNFLDLAPSLHGRWFLRRLIGRPHGVISVSPELQRSSALLRPALRELIPSGVDPQQFRPGDAGGSLRCELNLGPRDPLIAFVGRIHPVKGLDHLLEAFEQVRQAHTAARLMIVGDGLPVHERWLRDAVAQRGLDEHVVLRGRVDHGALPAYYAAADVVCLPSRMEATSLTGLEAMACERPVVATDVGGLPLIVKDGVTGLLVPLGDPSALAAALSRLLGDDALRQRMGTAGRERALQEFSWEAIARRTVAFYREVIGSWQGT
jgi:glycosyltransferase involved in cell wall biosynthesis